MKIRIVSVLKSLGSESLREESKTYAGGRGSRGGVRDSSQVSKGSGTKIIHKFLSGGLIFFRTHFSNFYKSIILKWTYFLLKLHYNNIRHIYFW